MIEEGSGAGSGGARYEVMLIIAAAKPCVMCPAIRAGRCGGFAAGAEKAPGVAGSLRTGALNGVILDEDLARALVELV